MQNNQQVGGINLPTTPTSWNVDGVGINSINSGLATGHDGDSALAQLVQAMAGFSPSGGHASAGPITAPSSDANSQLFASNPMHGYAH